MICRRLLFVHGACEAAAASLDEDCPQGVYVYIVFR